jgi:NAD-reducing hydrogenase large subunit
MKKTTSQPITRIGGHARVSILLSDAGLVREARLHAGKFRGYERFVLGRPYWELPVIAERLCGLCSVSHHLAAAKAVDAIVGVDRLTPTAQKMRRLMHCGQTLRSHARDLTGLSLPDDGAALRRYGREIVKATSGKELHGVGAIPGGVNRNLPTPERNALLEDLDRMLEYSRVALKAAEDCAVEDRSGPSVCASNRLSLVREDGALDLYDGGLRAIDAEGNILFEHVGGGNYLDQIAEGVRPWSYLKFPFLTRLGVADGWYRVGPLARMVTADFIDTPEADAARIVFVSSAADLGDEFAASRWARAIELLHACETIRILLEDVDLQGYELVAKGERRSEGVGIVEAPGGTLIHHYRVDENDQVTMANVIDATAGNGESMNRLIVAAAREFLTEEGITDELLLQIERAVRAHDPCLACAAHPVGAMPLEVSIIAADGAVLNTHRSAS